MKKRSALLALLLAGLMSVSVIGTAGCKKHVDKGDGDQNQTDTDNKGDDTNKPDGGDQTKPDDGKGEEKPDDGKDDPKPDDGKDDEPDEPVPVTSDTAISLVAGQSRTLAASEGVTWTTTDAAVATVNSAGLVTAKTAGVTKIRATKAGEIITCTVIVLAAQQSSSSGASKQPFTFNVSKQIGSVDISGGGPVVTDPDAKEYTVSFSNGAISQNVANGGLAVEPLVENEGYYLQGWYSDAGYTNAYDFNEPVTQTLNLYAKWGDAQGFDLIQGNYESIALEWSGSATPVQYRLQGESEWTAIDSELVRADGGSVRADILGLKAGVYDVQANGKTVTGIPVKAYDRSGYAHFKYTAGVGAYNDDGTLKNDALVIYVTDENKDTVMAEVAEKNSDVKMFKIPYSGYGKDWGDKSANGIGWWLNNNQYTSNNLASSKNKQPSNTYSTNGADLGFKMIKRPIVVRFLGTVTTPEGCTSYNHTDEGGGIGDNGHMVRMKDLKNVTIEGVGNDAVIQGWGFHFVSGGGTKEAGRGTSFEVRNLTFNEYPEDAIGMEGQATSKAITAPVERCWIHHNTFLPGYCANPAESDKKEGDGSCDFKRGYYFTCSYNYFEYCHKTNLIGSSDDSLQYNMTYHHNIWYQCGSRIPLTRQANVHFYNNYVFANPAEKTTPYKHIAKPELSYVHSLRASCYLFSEYNYYEGCKNILRGASEGGDGKFYGNTYYACADTKAPVTEVRTRTQAVTNSSKDPTTNTSYGTFDTDPNLFYYDAANGKSDCLLDDSISARLRTIFYAGALGHGGKTAEMQEMNTSPAKVITSITSPIKGKGQVVIFSVAAGNTTLEINAEGESPQVLRADGKIYLDTFSGARTVMLDAGTYMVCSGKKDKEITVNSMTVQEDTEAAKQARVEAAKRAIQAIPDTITRSSGTIIEQANAAYQNLITLAGRDELGEQLTQRLQKAQAAYEEIQIEYAIARIDYIGTVTQDSKADIDAASSAYALLHGSVQNKVTNYSKLIAAKTEFAKFAVDNVKFEIGRLPLSTELGPVLDSKPAIELALQLYKDALEVYETLGDEDSDKVDIKNITKSLEVLNAAMAEIEKAEKEAQNLASFIEQVGAIDSENVDMAKAGALKAAYEALTADQKTTITAEQKAKYDKVIAAYTEFMNQAVIIGFTSGNDDYYSNKADYISVSGKSTAVTEKFNGVDYTSAIKMESSTKITIKAAATDRKLVLHFASGASGSIKDANNDKNVYALEGTTVTIIIKANTEFTFTKKDGTKNYLFLAELLPVA